MEQELQCETTVHTSYLIPHTSFLFMIFTQENTETEHKLVDWELLNITSDETTAQLHLLWHLIMIYNHAVR